MPDASGAPVLMDGRLNLEQQKKRAKELFAAVQSGDPAALARLKTGHPRGASLKPTLVQLADAQLVLARENGFASWPKLKLHAEALREARAAARRPDLAPDTPATLHLRCGSDIQGALKRAGFAGAFRPFADPFCQGPIRRWTPEEQVEARARFVSEAYGLYSYTALDRLKTDYAALEGWDAFDQVVLWFEHDSFDQLILAYLLSRLDGRDLTRISLVCVDQAPAVARFKGLGQLAPEVIRLLWAQRTPVSAAMVNLGRRVWSALADPSPEALAAIARSGTPAVPPMAAALTRHLEELPSVQAGLSLTQQLSLAALSETGPVPARELFVQVQAREPLPFLGDAMYWAELAWLEAGGAIDAKAVADDPHQAWPKCRVSLTDLGRRLLAGEADFLDRAPIRFVGGVEIDSTKPCWRWDAGAGQPVLGDRP